MSIQPVSDKLFEYLISNTSGERFERIKGSVPFFCLCRSAGTRMASTALQGPLDLLAEPAVAQRGSGLNCGPHIMDQFRIQRLQEKFTVGQLPDRRCCTQGTINLLRL